MLYLRITKQGSYNTFSIDNEKIEIRLEYVKVWFEDLQTYIRFLTYCIENHIEVTVTGWSATIPLVEKLKITILSENK